MTQIILKVTPSLNRWAIFHNDTSVATFPTREEAERAALALAVRHPSWSTAKIALTREDGGHSEIRVY